MRLTVRSRLVIFALALGLPAECVLGDMFLLDFSRMVAEARRRRMS